MKKTIIYLFLGIAALVVAACSTKNDPHHLRIAYSPALCQAPLHIAVEKGFFEAEGIKPENVQFDAAHVQEAIGTNQVDVGFGLVSKFLQPVENGLPVNFIAGIHNGCIKVLTLKKSGIANLADLKGKRIGVPALSDAATLILKRGLSSAGISVDDRNPDVEFVVFSRNDLPQALQKGAVDVIALGDPIASIAEKEQDLAVILDTSKTHPYDKEYCCVIFITSKLAKEHPEIAAAVTRAILKASAWVQEHPEETAKIQIDKKYVSGDLAFNTKILKSYNYSPSVQGGYDAVRLNARQFAEIGILKKGTDAKAFADRVYLFQKDVPDSYSAADVANVK